MNFYSNTGELLFGTWLKRISNQFQQDILKIYNHYGIKFELSWFPVFYILREEKEISVTELATKLEVSHPAIIQVLKTLEEKNYVSSKQSSSDKRKNVIQLTPSGISFMEQAEPIWEKIKNIMDKMFEDGKYTKKLIPALTEFEELMADNGLYKRFIE